MFQQIKNIWDIMGAVQLFPSVIIFCLGLYFVVKDKLCMDPKKAPLVPMGLSIFAQFGFAWPSDMQDVFMDVTMGLVNAVIAIGMYSFADKYGLVDKLARRAGNVVDGDQK